MSGDRPSEHTSSNRVPLFRPQADLDDDRAAWQRAEDAQLPSLARRLVRALEEVERRYFNGRPG